jgi:hypothetical protein
MHGMRGHLRQNDKTITKVSSFEENIRGSLSFSVIISQDEMMQAKAIFLKEVKSH